MGNSFKSILNYLLKQAEDKKFPQKTFIFDKIKKNYNCALNFFECQTIFTNKPTGRIEFTCLGCEKIYHARIGRTGNLNRHLNSHQEQKLRKWIQLYDAWNTKCQHSKITAGVMIMVRYFITSNVALNELKNPILRYVFKKANISYPGLHTFRHKTLPEVMVILQSKIETKLMDAETICLITDIWTTRQMVDFIAVAVNITNEDFEKETFVIGMKVFVGRHTAERIKHKIEEIVNEYQNFLKKKIKGR
jgi:hypothetical protein